MRIYLDFDGPVVENRAKYGALYGEGMAEQGVAPLPVDQYWDLKRHRVPDPEICALTSPAVRVRDYLAFRDRLIEDPRFVALDTLVPGILDRMDRWRAEGHTLHLATMRKRDAVLHEQLEALGLAGRLDAVLCTPANDGSWETKARMIAEDRGASREPALLIGDTEGDILAARATGILVAVVTNGIRAEAMLRLFAPDAIAGSAADIDPAALGG